MEVKRQETEFNQLLKKRQDLVDKRNKIHNREKNLVRFMILSFFIHGLVFFHHLKEIIFGIPPDSRSDFISHARENPQQGSVYTGMLFIQILTLLGGEIALLYFIREARVASLKIKYIVNDIEIYLLELGSNERRPDLPDLIAEMGTKGQAAKYVKYLDQDKIYKMILGRFNESFTAFALGQLFALTMVILVGNAWEAFVFEDWSNLLRNTSKFGLFLSSMALYHFAEYMYYLEFRYNKLDWHSFLIDQSTAYVVAFFLCCIEFYTRQKIVAICAPSNLNSDGSFFWVLSLAHSAASNIESSIVSKTFTFGGIVLLCIGHTFRIGALFQAKRNFNHVVQSKQEEGHNLVTSGVYSVSRHPSYFGWFLWAIGTQMMLSNVVCFFFWFYAGWKFFSERIPVEEYYLLTQYGDDYVRYAMKTPILIPFVKQHPFFSTEAAKKVLDKPVKRD